MARKPPGDDYEVGYGRPPQHSRFGPGRSGNLKGRPKGSKNLDTLLTAALEEKVVVKEDGRRRTITKREIIIKQLVNKSAGADLQAMRMLLGMLEALEGRVMATEAARPGEQPLPDADRQVMHELRKRLLRSNEDGDA